MRLVSFKTLSIRNFLSVGEVPANINFQAGVNVITGINHDKEDSKNGVGKSTIIDALYFALFGTTIRELSKDLIVNSYTKKNCEVKLDFQVYNNGDTSNYQIIRTISPTKCFLSKDGVDITHSTMAKTNEHIQKIIRSTSKVFQNSIIMTINNTVPFMAQSKIDKRKFIESVLNLEVFSDMLSRVRDEYNDTKRDYEVLFGKNSTVEKNYTLNKQQFEHFEETKNNKIAELNNKITDFNTKISNLKKEITTVPENAESLLEAKCSDIENEIKEIQKQYKEEFRKYTEIKTKIRFLNEQIDEIKAVGSICTTCKRSYSDDDIKHKEENIDKLQQDISSLSSTKTELDINVQTIEARQNEKESEYKEFLNKKTKLNNIIQTNKQFVSKIDLFNESIEDLNSDLLSTINLSNHTLEKAVQELENEFNSNKEVLTKLDTDLSVLECVKFVVSEEGVKSYIVRKVLKVLNSRLAHYLEMLNANCLCQFNEYFDEIITDEKGSTKSYFNFSGGERKRIDLACLFAFLDIRRMQGDVHFSTIFYDELLDSSLDDNGVQLVLRVLRERQQKYNESCYIITHRGTTITAKVDNIINLEKRNGFTYIL